MKITLEEMAQKLKISPKTLWQWRWKYKNTNDPKAIFAREGIGKKPVYFDESVQQKYFELLANES